MKTAISVPDQIFEAADNLAKRLGMSRSQLYTTAVTQYLESHTNKNVTKMLNEVYGESAKIVDQVLMQMQLYILPDEDWT